MGERAVLMSVSTQGVLLGHSWKQGRCCQTGKNGCSQHTKMSVRGGVCTLGVLLAIPGNRGGVAAQ